MAANGLFLDHALQPFRSAGAIPGHVRRALGKGDGYFYIWSGETTGRLDRTVKLRTSEQPDAKAVGGRVPAAGIQPAGIDGVGRYHAACAQ